MISLLLSIAGYVFIAFILRWGGSRRRSRMTLMAVNYAAGSLIAGGYYLLTHGADAPSVEPAHILATMLWGSVTGFLYAASLLVWIVVIEQVGVGPSTTASRLSVVWPALVSVVVFREIPSVWQGFGFALAGTAIALLALQGALSVRPASVTAASVSLNSGGPHPMGGSHAAWVIALWLSSGACGSLLKLFHELGGPGQLPLFLFLIFASAGVFCWVWVGWKTLRGGLRLHGPDLRDGALFGVSNVASNFFFLRSLETVPGVVAFPLRDSGVILLVTLLGILVWKERPGSLGWAALAAAASAVVLLAL